MCLLGDVNSENIIVMSPGFSTLADEQHLTTADLLAKGNVTFKRDLVPCAVSLVFGCLASCKTWSEIPCHVSRTVRLQSY